PPRNVSSPSSTWNPHAAAVLPCSAAVASTRRPAPNSSHHSLRYAGVWKKVPLGSSITAAVQSAVWNAVGSSANSMRMAVLPRSRQVVRLSRDGVRRRAGGAPVARLGQRILQHVPRQHGAFDPHRILDHALEGDQVAKLFLGGIDLAAEHAADAPREGLRVVDGAPRHLL